MSGKVETLFHLSGNQLLKTDSFVSGSIQNIVKMNSQTERSLRQQRRWANQRQQEKERKQQKVQEEKEYDDNQYMDMRETIAAQTLTYLRTRGQLDMAREEIETLIKEKRELEEIISRLRSSLEEEQKTSQRRSEYICNLLCRIEELQEENE
jgi:beta-N-acetylglucosaminidase